MSRFALMALASAILTATAAAQTAPNIEEIHITGRKKPLPPKKIASCQQQSVTDRCYRCSCRFQACTASAAFTFLLNAMSCPTRLTTIVLPGG